MDRPVERDEKFSVVLSNPTPQSNDKKSGAMLSKKNLLMVNIVTDNTAVRQKEVLM
jgi:hypothetical protein